MKLTFPAAILLLAAFGISPAIGSSAELPRDANTTCPIMLEEESDPDIYVEHEGEKVYLCCTKCKREFRKDPEKYMTRIKEARASKPKAAPRDKDAGTTTSR